MAGDKPRMVESGAATGADADAARVRTHDRHLPSMPRVCQSSLETGSWRRVKGPTPDL